MTVGEVLFGLPCVFGICPAAVLSLPCHHNRSRWNALICQWFGCAENRRTELTHEFPSLALNYLNQQAHIRYHYWPEREKKLNTRHVYNILRAAPMKRSFGSYILFILHPIIHSLKCLCLFVSRALWWTELANINNCDMIFGNKRTVWLTLCGEPFCSRKASWSHSIATSHPVTIWLVWLCV